MQKHARKNCCLEPARNPKAVVCDGLDLTFYEQAYGDPDYGKFWGGNTPTASWLSRDSIEQCFRHFGYELTRARGQPPPRWRSLHHYDGIAETCSDVSVFS